jgi:CRISPR-associated Cas5-like protein
MNQSFVLFLRLEGPLQAWGDTSKFVIRRSMDAPTKSGVLGLICCAMELSRQAARGELSELNKLAMGVRVDRPGTRWWDYHTVGAGIGLLTAEGNLKAEAKGTLVSRREYLSDASFLVALQGDEKLIDKVRAALAKPKWTLFLGRKSCPPAAPILVKVKEGDGWSNPMPCDKLSTALGIPPWQPRLKNIDNSPPPDGLTCLIEWRTSIDQPFAPDDAEVWYDTPVSFEPPVHEPRLVIRDSVPAKEGGATQRAVPSPSRPRADYGNSEYKKRRLIRIDSDHGLCVFCKNPAQTVQHITYRNAGGNEKQEDLRSLCRLCHDACTMLEYGMGMGLDRINPEEPCWRERIIQKREEIIKFRSMATRKRKFEPEPEEVE